MFLHPHPSTHFCTVPPKIHDIQERILVEGDSMVLPCESTGDPVPIVKWYRNNTPFTEGKQEVSINQHNTPFTKGKLEVSINQHNMPFTKGRLEVSINQNNT